MKFTYFLLICFVSAAFAQQQPKFNFKESPTMKLPQITANGGGSGKQGFDINVDARQNVWNSPNGRHSIDATGGYSQHLGGPYGNSPADKRFGAAYTFKFG